MRLGTEKVRPPSQREGGNGPAPGLVTVVHPIGGKGTTRWCVCLAGGPGCRRNAVTARGDSLGLLSAPLFHQITALEAHRQMPGGDMQIFGSHPASSTGQKLVGATNGTMGSWFLCLWQEGHEGEAARNETWACRDKATDTITGKWKAEEFRNSENSCSA